MPCPCGKTVHKYYKEKHQQTNIHKLKLKDIFLIYYTTIKNLYKLICKQLLQAARNEAFCF